MPIYEYSCQSCGKTIDVLQKVSDPTPESCTACGTQGSLSKVVSRSSFVLKGGAGTRTLQLRQEGRELLQQLQPALVPSSSSSSSGASSSDSGHTRAAPAPRALPAAAAGTKS